MVVIGGANYSFRMQDALSQRVRGWTPFFVMADALSVTVSFFASFALSQLLPPDGWDLALLPPSKEFVLPMLSIVALAIHSFFWLGEDGYMQRLLGGQRWRMCTAQWMFMALGVFVYVALWRDYQISRKLLLLDLVLVLPVLWLGKFLFSKLLKSLGARLQPRLRILAVCDATSAEATRSWFSNKQMLGIHLCEVLTAESADIHSTQVESRLNDAITRGQPNLVIWRLPTDAARTERLRVITESRGTHLAVDLNPILGEMAGFQVAEYAFMKLVSLHRHPLVSPAHRLLKRLLDVAVSLPVVLFVLPGLCVLVGLLHRVFSPGPLFFKQIRSGANGEKFQIYKFRTMSVNHGTESTQARPNDTRVFPGGALLRKLSIDEMPQFLNVFAGSMSVVGPRPHMLEHDVLFALSCHQYPMRHAVKPGVTGLAQVRGFRGPIDDESDIRHRVTSDIEYCQTWSLGLDLGIIARTFLHVFSFHAKSC